MEENPEEFKGFMMYDDDMGPDKAWRKYLNKMKGKGWGGPHELRALESCMNRKFEIWLAIHNDLEEATDIQVLRDHPVNLDESTVTLWYVANTQHDGLEDIGDHYMALVPDGSGLHIHRESRYESTTLEEILNQ
jgi:hypothetical protein